MTVSHLFSNWISEMKPNAIRAVVNRSSGPEFVSFTAGKPAPSLFPIERLKEKSAAVLDEYGGESLQYFGTQGHPPLRTYLAQRFEASEPDDVLIISGSQQGIDLAGKLFVNPGDKVATAAPTFPGALSAMRVHEPEIIGVACDHEGMLPTALEAVLKQGVKFIYCIPNFMNPTGGQHEP
ncbi:MAG: PLP-dependent aminotransferase family protein [Chloroflexota bacterium]